MKLKIRRYPQVIKMEDGNIRSIETCYDVDLDISPEDVRVLDEYTQEEYFHFMRKKLRELV